MAPTKDTLLLTLVDRIYQSIEQPEQWPATIRAIGTVIGGRPDFWDSAHTAPSTKANAASHEAGCHGTLFLSRADLRTLDEYAQEFGELIVRFLKIVFLSTLTSQSNLKARELIGFRMTRYYLEGFGPLSAKPETSASRSARNLIAALWEDGRTFDSGSVRAMHLLMPHLNRALRLQTRLNTDALRADTVSGALDRLTVGVVLVDRSGLPLWHNRRAKEIVGRSNDLRFSSAGFVGRTPAHTRALRELVAAAVFGGAQEVLAVDRGDQARALLLVASPLKSLDSAQALEDCSQTAGGVVFICDPDRDDEPTVESLQSAFKLTPREAQLAIAIARGHGLSAAAETMGVALTTARTQLQQTFAKTGTNHQAELAALVHRTLAHLRHD
ncbi:MAG: hypothetical protein K2Y71_04720 [Xanthobacteraceae bacterium]|nr:hypothetical protein [Xanthobacteraceae bacterium]